jgi:hypothetical protein
MRIAHELGEERLPRGANQHALPRGQKQIGAGEEHERLRWRLGKAKPRV